VVEINLAIGATGVVSGECKMIVEQYGDHIIELLLEEVLYSANSCTSCRTVLHLNIITLMAPACHIEQ
jgi:phytepsin